MRLNKIHWIGIISGSVVAIIDFIFFLNDDDINLFLFVLGLSIIVIILPFLIALLTENKKEKENSGMFLEFSRNLAESVATGTPISKSIINMRKNDYGSLSEHIQKLSNQIEIGIPVNRALDNFSRDVRNPVISRAIALINEAEKAGGEIDFILDSTAKSIAEVEKLQKERKAVIYNLVVQGYIIFFIFIGIMLVMEFKILPLVSGVGDIGSFGSNVGSLTVDSSSSIGSSDPEAFTRPFLLLLLTQGLFAGLVIGKLSEGNIKAGIKHSFAMMIAAFLISTGARLFLSSPV